MNSPSVVPPSPSSASRPLALPANSFNANPSSVEDVFAFGGGGLDTVAMLCLDHDKWYLPHHWNRTVPLSSNRSMFAYTPRHVDSILRRRLVIIPAFDPSAHLDRGDARRVTDVLVATGSKPLIRRLFAAHLMDPLALRVGSRRVTSTDFRRWFLGDQNVVRRGLEEEEEEELKGVAGVGGGFRDSGGGGGGGENRKTRADGEKGNNDYDSSHVSYQRRDSAKGDRMDGFVNDAVNGRTRATSITSSVLPNAFIDHTNYNFHDPSPSLSSSSSSSSSSTSSMSRFFSKRNYDVPHRRVKRDQTASTEYGLGDVSSFPIGAYLENKASMLTWASDSFTHRHHRHRQLRTRMSFDDNLEEDVEAQERAIRREAAVAVAIATEAARKAHLTNGKKSKFDVAEAMRKQAASGGGGVAGGRDRKFSSGKGGGQIGGEGGGREEGTRVSDGNRRHGKEKGHANEGEENTTQKNSRIESLFSSLFSSSASSPSFSSSSNAFSLSSSPISAAFDDESLSSPWLRDPKQALVSSDLPRGFYSIPYRTNYEPWFVVARDDSPAFDLRFRGHGGNKIQQVAKANALNYQLLVHPLWFTVHMPHRASHAKHAAQGNLTLTLGGRKGEAEDGSSDNGSVGHEGEDVRNTSANVRSRSEGGGGEVTEGIDYNRSKSKSGNDGSYNARWSQTLDASLFNLHERTDAVAVSETQGSERLDKNSSSSSSDSFSPSTSNPISALRTNDEVMRSEDLKRLFHLLLRRRLNAIRYEAFKDVSRSKGLERPFTVMTKAISSDSKVMQVQDEELGNLILEKEREGEGDGGKKKKKGGRKGEDSVKGKEVPTPLQVAQKAAEEKGLFDRTASGFVADLQIQRCRVRLPWWSQRRS